MQKSSANVEEEVNEVNVTPLADVTLVLLIVLMVISPMALQSMIQVQASQAVAAPAKTDVKEKPLFVDVKSNGFSINNKEVGTEYELYRLLQKNLAYKKDKMVLISASPEVRYQTVVRVLDLVKQSGAVSLSLVPRKKEAS